ncbi:MAG: ATP-grasp domain-containing protein [Pirellulales bacterium]|nr:ATP-grasp domain-containing protein [Pirellulales bacterium]
MPDVTWVLEPNIFPETHGPIRKAIRDQGYRIVEWSDTWWSEGVPSHIPTSSVVFHGSLGNAARITDELQWTPGSFCPVEFFRCSTWYESAREWLIHSDWKICPANELVANSRLIANELGSTDRLFVRPDSPLKPFSGRVVDIATLTLAKLDHGFYYDDDSILVVVAPIQTIGNEWRFVIANRSVIAGSAYDPKVRKPVTVQLNSSAANFASTIATSLAEPDNVYILDVCECNGQLRLLELNPFGGADLYACDPVAIVERVSALASSM